MKSPVVAALGAALIAMVGASSAAQAAMVTFSFGAFDGSITHDGASLDVSTLLDLDGAFFLVMEVNPGDASGLSAGEAIILSAETSPVSKQILYGSGSGPTVDKPLGAKVILSWPMTPAPGADIFTETLTTVDAIDRGPSDEIAVTLSGTLSDKDGHFPDSPALIVMRASQDLGATFPTVTFTNELAIVTPSIPEPSTWVMMALGFGALGYAVSRRGKTKIAMLSA